MSKGTASFGKKNKTRNVACRRCNRISYNIKKKKCSYCSFGKSSKLLIKKINKTLLKKINNLK